MVNATLVTVHGFWSTPATWDRLCVVWQADDELRNLQIHGFGYPSPKKPRLLLSGTRVPDFYDIAQTLATEYVTVLRKAPNIVFVTHSQGGLILQRFLAWMVSEGRARELERIKSVVMLACPNGGSQYLAAIRHAFRYDRHPQASDLRVLNRSVADTQRSVLDHIVNAPGVDDQNCRIPFHVYAAHSDAVVPAASAQSAFPSVGTLPGDHSTILDPAAPGNRTADIVKYDILGDLAERPPGSVGGAGPAGRSSTESGKPPISLSGTQGVQVGDYNVQYNIFFPQVVGGDTQHPPPPDHREQGESSSGEYGTADEPGVPVRWMQSAERVEHFTGRAEELARLDRWAADPQVSLIGVTAWGGAGKTSLVTRWVEAGGPARRPGIRGVFGWSFLDDPSAEHWAQGLLEWARQELKIEMADTGRLAATTLMLLRTAPLLVVLDGLEVMQEDRDGIRGFGRLLDGLLREVLVGACYQPCAGLIVLTSRFPFADLEGFDGGSARMLNVPPFTPGQGSALLAAAGGAWLPDRERRALVQAVDGHALATGVLAGLLAAHLPDTELVALRSSLAGATQTNARVGKVLEFYAVRLSEPDRYLMAAVSLFARPVSPEAVLTVAKHEVFGSRLDEWTPAMVQSAVGARLAGLAFWHREEGSISAHPLVRDTFRRLVMDAAGTAAETALAVVPPGIVTSRADGLRVVEVIELLLDADQWQTADGIYRARCDNGKIWRRLPAAAFGQRAATAFVAAPERRDACARHLGPGLLGFYLGDVGLFAMYAGDLETARRHLRMAADHNRDARDIGQLTTALRNLAVCLGYLGQAGPAQTAAAESVTCAEASGDRLDVCESRAYLAWLAGMAGNPAMAEHQFTAADQLEIADSGGYHLYTVRGVWWADWLARTGRLGPAREVAERSAEICRKNGWYQNVARSDRMLGRIALIGGNTTAAGEYLTAAAAVFRDGDFLVELAITLVDLADYAAAAGDLDGAEQHATEAFAIAGRRGLVPVHCAALAARARARARRFTATSNPDLIHDGRDDADAALRLAGRHDEPWYELDALRAHAALDRAESIDRGWAGQADVVRERLVPGGLDPDPLATIERLVGDGKA